MLKTRILTIIFLLPLVIAGIFYLPSNWFAIILGAAILYGVWEWGQLLPKTNLLKKILLITVIAISFFLSIKMPDDILFYSVIPFWCILLYWLLRYPNAKMQWFHTTTLFIFAFFDFVPSWKSISLLHEIKGPLIVLYLFSLVWASDIGGYVIGKWKGKHALLQYVSPKKTLEGAAGSFIFTLIISLIFGFYLQQSFMKSSILAILITIFSMLGDLIVSMTKRASGVKDSGMIFPGHGGMLDRINSLLAAAPIFYLCSEIFSKAV